MIEINGYRFSAVLKCLWYCFIAYSHIITPEVIRDTIFGRKVKLCKHEYCNNRGLLKYTFSPNIFVSQYLEQSLGPVLY